jgi:hypothetical protein
MTMRISLAAVILTLSACASGGVGRGPDPEMMAAYRGTQAPSIYGLIGARERLGLTSIQVTTLDSIAESLRARNTRLSDSLRAIRDVGPGGPIPLPRDSAEHAGFVPVLREMARNNQASVAAVQALLTEDQRRIACELQRENPGMRGRDGMRGRGSGGPPRGGMRRGMDGMEMEGDTLRGMGRAWPWCPPPAAPAQARG